MSNQNAKNKSWVARHKKGIVIALTVGAVVGTVTGVYLLSSSGNAGNLIGDIKSKVFPAFNKKSCSTDIHIKSSCIQCKASDTVSNIITDITSEISSKRSYTPCDRLIDVSDHLRKLPDGWNPSEEKILQGKAMGLDLIKMHCTIVNPYQKGAA